MIRKFVESDRDAIKMITSICFAGVSIDENIEKIFGKIGELSWQQRISSYVNDDINANAQVFVEEADGQVAGYVSTHLNSYTKIGWISFLAVLPDYQKKGIGSKLLETALKYFREQGMILAKIETLEQNEVCKDFYPRIGFKEVARKIHYVKLLNKETSHKAKVWE